MLSNTNNVFSMNRIADIICLNRDKLASIFAATFVFKINILLVPEFSDVKRDQFAAQIPAFRVLALRVCEAVRT